MASAVVSEGSGREVDAPRTVGDKAKRVARAVLGFLLAQWLIIGFGVACVLAYFFPCELLRWPCFCFICCCLAAAAAVAIPVCDDCCVMCRVRKSKRAIQDSFIHPFIIPPSTHPFTTDDAPANLTPQPSPPTEASSAPSTASSTAPWPSSSSSAGCSSPRTS